MSSMFSCADLEQGAEKSRKEYSSSDRSSNHAFPDVPTQPSQHSRASGTPIFRRLAQVAMGVALVTTYILYQRPLSRTSIVDEPSAGPTSVAPPTVQLDQATVTGTVLTAPDSTGASQSVNAFLGIRYATAARFEVPALQTTYTENIDASQFGAACPQQNIPLPSGHGPQQNALILILKQFFKHQNIATSEDCFNLNVYAPTDASPSSGLPVVVWIYGGGFEEGAAQTYKGENMIAESINLQKQMIFVSMNYSLWLVFKYLIARVVCSPNVTAFGFLAGSEVVEAGIGNLGLRDQRAALQWVHQFIAQFGGDPSMVTIWGESAGAMSVGLHMLTNNGDPEGLFRAAIMQSGSPRPVGDSSHGQKYYDELVEGTNCSNATSTLSCLRTADSNTLYAAVNATPSFFSTQALNLAWLPRVDGEGGFLPQPPPLLVKNGPIAQIPFISGDCDDEGTLFTLGLLNLNSTADLTSWLAGNLLPSWDSPDAQNLVDKYPYGSAAYNSPFNTNTDNNLSPEWMQTAAIQGDVVFQAPRRFLMQNAKTNSPMWGFLSTRSKRHLLLSVQEPLNYIGSFHGNHLIDAFNNQNPYLPGHSYDLQQYIICFVHDLNPEGTGSCGVQPQWPQYDATSTEPTLLEFAATTPTLISPSKALITQTVDTYRVDAFQFIYGLIQKHPLGQHP